ncbi:kanadaptin-like [Schistocerca gregaria]|uniref:kanadaptin-like n=1 Tax=Schistocerca gregaria TaxID=7010 RepID=UPI00211DA920|nr:kanadaptin-like [Schistocerca gregaria]
MTSKALAEARGESVESRASSRQQEHFSFEVPEWAHKSGEPLSRKYYFEIEEHGVVVGRLRLDAKSFYLFGRAPSCDVVLDHISISRHHAALVYDRKGAAYLCDMGSANGSYVGNKSLSTGSYGELKVGDRVRFGCSGTYILREEVQSDDEDVDSKEDLDDLDDEDEVNKRDALDLDMVADYLGRDAIENIGDDDYYDRTLDGSKKRKVSEELAESDLPETFETAVMKRRLLDQYAAMLNVQISRLNERIHEDRERRSKVDEADSLDAYMLQMSETLDEERYLTKKMRLREEFEKYKEVIEGVIERLKPAVEGVVSTCPKALEKSTNMFRAKLMAKIKETGSMEKVGSVMLPPTRRVESKESAAVVGQNKEVSKAGESRNTNASGESRNTNVPGESSNTNTPGESNEEDYEEWRAPAGQTGDGRTSLNDKYGY